MADLNGTPSELEIKNAQKVKLFLTDIDDIGYEAIREDIFKVVAGSLNCIVDVEETIVTIAMEVCDIPSDDTKKNALFELLLKLNKDAIHGKFALIEDKVYVLDNLEIENLDQNELEASLGWVFTIVNNNLEAIAELTDESEAEEN